jgi:uncharacterized small protein (DUF1192 family)
MRLIVTADLHANHARSQSLAIDAIAQINATPGDALLLVGDTATADEGQLEAALSRITFDGPKLFVAGNHELWTRRADSHAIFTGELPERVRALGWHWLEGDAFEIGDLAIVGSVGWYDYSYAPDSLDVPRRFYEAKVSPGAAEHLTTYQHLLDEDVTDAAKQIVARWNDAKFVKLGRSDVSFLDERIAALRASIARVRASRIVAAVHHVPFRQLLPPRHSGSGAWDFARAYLGSDRLGEVFLEDPRVSHVFCGHSHFAVREQIGRLQAINVGSGYRQKHVVTIDV